MLETPGGDEKFTNEILVTRSEGVDSDHLPPQPGMELVSDGQRIHLFRTGGRLSEGGRAWTQLLWSVFEAGEWSEPQVIFENPTGIRWYSRAEAVVADGQGLLHLMLSKTRCVYKNCLVYLRWRGGTWERAVAPRGDAANVELWAKGDTLYALIVDGALDLMDSERLKRMRGDRNSVLFYASYDGGEAWEEPVVVNWSGRLQAGDPALTVSDSGVLHAAWSKDLTGDWFSEAIWTSTSFDGGVTWTAPEEIEHGSGFVGRVEWADTCGRPGLVFNLFGGSAYAVRRGSHGWLEPEAIATGFKGENLSYDVISGSKTHSAELVIAMFTGYSDEDVERALRGEPVLWDTVIRHFQAIGKMEPSRDTVSGQK